MAQTQIFTEKDFPHTHHLFSYHQFTEEKHFPPLYTSFLASIEIVIFLRGDEISCKLLNSIIEAATILLRSMDECLYCPDYFQSYNPQFQNIVRDKRIKATYTLQSFQVWSQKSVYKYLMRAQITL